MTGRRGRRRRKLLDDLKQRRGYSHLKEEAPDRTNVDRSLWNRLCTCRETDLMNECTQFTYLVAGHTVQSCGPWVENTCFK